MTSFLTISVIVLIFVVSYKQAHCIIHPSVVVSGTWSGVLLLYQCANHELYPLSDHFWNAILLWVCVFCCTAFLCSKMKIYFPSCILVPYPKKRLVKFLFYFLFAVNCYYLYRLYNLGQGQSFYNLLVRSGPMPWDLQIISYLNKASILLVLTLLFCHTSIKKYQALLFFILLVVCYVLVSVKTVFAQLLCAFFIYLWWVGKLSLKRILILLIGGVILMQSLQIFRSNSSENNYDYIRFFQLYVLSPLPAFDMLLNQEVHYEKGKTFYFFNSLLSSAGLLDDTEEELDEQWVKVPIYTNVYTVMFPFYNDYAYWGIGIFAMILGGFWGILYKGLLKKIPFAVIIYAALFYSLPLQFFSDYIFIFLSVTFQMFIILTLFFVRFRFK